MEPEIAFAKIVGFEVRPVIQRASMYRSSSPESMNARRMKSSQTLCPTVRRRSIGSGMRFILSVVAPLQRSHLAEPPLVALSAVVDRTRERPDELFGDLLAHDASAEA